MNEFSRRDFLKNGTLTAGALAMGLSLKGGPALAAPPAKARVFFTRDLSAEGLLNIYAKVNEGMTGRVALKLHTGEPNGPNIAAFPVSPEVAVKITISFFTWFFFAAVVIR